MRELSKKEKLFIFIYILLFSFLSIVVIYYLLSQKLENIDPDTINTKENLIQNTTGAIYLITTGDIISDTGVIIPIPDDPREYLEYIMEDGEGGVDYIVATPINQPKMDSKVGTENTKEMHKYIHENKIRFDFNPKGKKGYIMFITTKELPKSRNLFLGVDGITIGWLDKEASLNTYSHNEYLYELDKIKYFWSGNNFKYKNLSKSPIFINAVVGQSGNKVEKIIIFFK